MALLAPFVFKDFTKLFEKKAIPIHGRSIAGAIAIGCLFWTLKNTSAIHASFMASLAPLFLMLIMFITEKERLGISREVSLIFIIIGSVIVAGSPDLSAPLIVWAVGLVGAFLSAIAMFFLKRSTGQYSSKLIVFNLGIVLLLLGAKSTFSKNFTSSDLIWLIIMGATSAIAQILMTISYRGLQAQVANGLGRSLILWVALFEFLWSHDLPGVVASVGYLMATIGIIGIQRRGI